VLVYWNNNARPVLGSQEIEVVLSTAFVGFSEIRAAFAHCIHRNLRLQRELKLTPLKQLFNVAFVDG